MTPKEFMETLDDHSRSGLIDALVLGDFDWRDWGMDEKPNAAWLNEVFKMLQWWEESRL